MRFLAIPLSKLDYHIRVGGFTNGVRKRDRHSKFLVHAHYIATQDGCTYRARAPITWCHTHCKLSICHFPKIYTRYNTHVHHVPHTEHVESSIRRNAQVWSGQCCAVLRLFRSRGSEWSVICTSFCDSSGLQRAHYSPWSASPVTHEPHCSYFSCHR